MAGKGQNVWYELMTTDIKAAIRFYTEAIGWRTEDWPDAPPGMEYTMWKTGESALGGVMKLPEEAAKMGVPPHWVSYTQVEDVDATVAEAKKLGGKVLKDAFDIPEVGRMAFLADPQGASFAVFRSKDPTWDPPDASLAGMFSWAELNTTDYEAAWEFYSQLFGWVERSKMDMGEAGTYFMFNDKTQKTKGGMSNMAKQMNMPPHWLHYVNVDDMNAAVERIKKGGGKILNGPMEIPGDDMIAQCMDPQGAAFAIYAEGKKK